MILVPLAVSMLVASDRALLPQPGFFLARGPVSGMHRTHSRGCCFPATPERHEILS